MGRPGMSSGGGGSSGGHSSGRSSGGHHVGSSGRSSRPMGGSSSFRPGGSSGGGWGPPPPGGGFHNHYYGGYGGYYPPRRSSSIGSILTAIFFLFVFLFVFVSSFSNGKQVSTRNREKIENPVAYTNDCVKDEIGYVEDTSALSRNLQNFHNRNLLGGLYRENPVKSRNYEAVKSSKKWENVGNSYIIPALLLYRYSYI